MKPPTKAPVLHFDARGGSYWIAVKDEFIPLDTGQAKLHMRAGGLDKESYTDGLNEIERALYTAQVERLVHYAGPLAGHVPGAFETDCGRRVLVTAGPRLPKAREGGCNALEKFIGELLGSEQGPHFCLWLAAGRHALATRSFRPGQFTALAGPSGCGKSLLQTLVTASLGGRSSCPYQYMTGQTAFNQHLAESEHWCIEDQASSTDIRTRRKFGVALKEAVVNTKLMVYPKGQKAMSLPTFRRCTGSFNREVENVMFMPPIDESIADKVNLYDCSHADVGDDREKTWSTFTRELPAFLWRCHKLKVPAKWRDDRYGLRAYHAPALLEILTAAAPETRLLSIIDESIFAGQKLHVPWVGSATQLEGQLVNGDFGQSVAKLLYYSTACGVYLARLAEKQPERISCERRGGGKVVWTITAP